MLRYLMIMNKDTGIPFFSQSYGFDSDENCECFNGKMSFLGPEILGGFLVTLMGFGTQFNYGEIDEIAFKEILIRSWHTRDIVTIAVEEKHSEGEETKALLNRITTDFIEMYGDRIKSWDGDHSAFRNFEEHLLENGVLTSPKNQCRDCIPCPDSKRCVPKMMQEKAYSACGEEI